MQMRTLGRSGLSSSPIGLGTWAIGGPWRIADSDHPGGWGEVDDGESLRAIARGLDLGVTLFDTAPNYGCGHSERLLGQALEGRRDEVIIATKFGYVIDEDARVVTGEDLTPAGIRASCDGSLRRLRTDHIDIYQCHVGRVDHGLIDSIGETLESLADEGKIGWYGWSTHDIDGVRRLAAGRRCSSVEHVFNVLQRTDQLLDAAVELDLASLTMSPLAEGILTGKFTRRSKLPADDQRRNFDFEDGSEAELLSKTEAILDVLRSDGRTAAQGALCWLLARSLTIVPIPGFKNAAQVEDNVGAAQLGPLPEQQMQAIEEAVTVAA